MLLLLILLFVGFCAFVAYAPAQLTQALLAGVWVLMALAAVGLPVLSLFRVI